MEYGDVGNGMTDPKPIDENEFAEFMWMGEELDEFDQQVLYAVMLSLFTNFCFRSDMGVVVHCLSNFSTLFKRAELFSGVYLEMSQGSNFCCLSDHSNHPNHPTA